MEEKPSVHGSQVLLEQVLASLEWQTVEETMVFPSSSFLTLVLVAFPLCLSPLVHAVVAVVLAVVLVVHLKFDQFQLGMLLTRMKHLPRWSQVS